MQKTPMTDQNRKAAITLAAVLLLFAVYCGFAYFKYIVQTKRTPPTDLIVFENLPGDVKLEASLQNRSGVSPLAFAKNSLALSEEQKKNFSLPYSISARITEGDSTYSVKWSIDNIGAAYSVALEGFKPDDRVSFILNNSRTVSKVPFDWSGRLTLEAFMIKDKDMTACVEVTGSLPLDLCHNVTGLAGAV